MVRTSHIKMKLVIGLVLLCTVVSGATFGRKHLEISAIRIQSYPWTVYLIGENNTRCGGSIISSNFVLSTAFCAESIPITIFFGAQNLSAPLFTRTVAENEMFTNILENLLLLRVEDIDFGLSVQPIRLPKYSEVGFNQWTGYIAFLTGFGVNNRLSLAHIEIVPDAKCNENLDLDVLPLNGICGRVNNGDCITGMGTPLTILEDDGVPTQIGISIQTNTECRSPSKFIGIEYDLDWIYDTTDLPFRY